MVGDQIPTGGDDGVGSLLMMIRLEGFHAVVKEKIDEDGVDFCVGVLALDFSLEEFYCPYAATCDKD